MKRAALCLLAIAAPACNWVFGIEPTFLVDGGPGPPGESPFPTARLSWMIAVTDVQGAPVAAAEFRGITPAPSPQIGRITGALTDVTLDTTGTFEIPRDFPGTAWRLVYQLPNDIPREVHWTPAMGVVAHATVPLHGRLDRAQIPGPNTVMSLTAAGSPDPRRAPRVFTTGVWTESLPVAPAAGTTFNYNLNQSIQLSGLPGAPEHLKGDQVVLSDFDTTTGTCRLSSGSAAFKLDLIDGVSTTVTAEAWMNTPISVTPSGGDTSIARIRTGLSAGTGPGAVRVVTQVGPSPSATMPAFTLRSSVLGLRGPLLLAMLDCDNTLSSTLPNFNMPVALSVFPRLAQLQLTADRVVMGASLTSGYASVTLMTGDSAAFDLTIAIPVAPFMLGPVDLSTMDQSPLPAGTDPLVFTFGNEGQQVIPDYYEVVVHRITGGSAVPVRAYTIATPSLTIERTVLTPAGEYVLQVRAFRGAPGASVADFTRYSSSQSAAVAWTHSFIAP